MNEEIRPYGNETKFGMQSDPLRYFCASYHIFVLLSSFIGDTVILMASFQKNAFKVNKSIVAIIRHISVADLVHAVFVVLPGAISLITKSWVEGYTMCFISVFIAYFTFPTGMYLIATMTTCKLLVLQFPRHAWSLKKTHLICCAIWIISLANSLFMVLIDRDRDEYYFDFRVYNCWHWSTAKVWNYLNPLLCFIFLLSPILLIISTTIPTLKYIAAARKSARRVRASVPSYQAAIAVVLTAVSCCVSTLPTVVYYAGDRFLDPSGPFRFQLFRISYFLAMLNIMSNFYIYALTIRSFRKFILLKITSVVPVSSPISGRWKLSSNGKNSLLIKQQLDLATMHEQGQNL